MFQSARKRIKASQQLTRAICIDPLESRQLLSASGFGGWGNLISAFGGGFGGGFGQHGGGHNQETIPFSLAPTAVQTGLDSLAAADRLTDPTSSATVHLGNVKRRRNLLRHSQRHRHHQHLNRRPTRRSGDRTDAIHHHLGNP